jgi:Malectin domain
VPAAPAPPTQREAAAPNAPARSNRLFRRGAAVALLALAVLAAAAVRNRTVKANDPGEFAKTRETGSVPGVIVNAPQPVRILAGSTVDHLTDRSGAEWFGDRYFSGGYQDSLRFGDQERSVRHPFILGAPEQTPFHSFRAGHFSYRIPMPAGVYELRLYFSEVVLGLTDSGDGAENQRVFDVLLNGRPLLTYFDIFSEAGAANTAAIRVFENVSPAPDGFLTLEFRPIREVAWLNAIELIPNSTARPEPLRIVPRSADYLDRTGPVVAKRPLLPGWQERIGRDQPQGNFRSGTVRLATIRPLLLPAAGSAGKIPVTPAFRGDLFWPGQSRPRRHR